MLEKFDKYWKDCSLVLAIAVIMHPRFKMKLVEFSYHKIYGQDAQRYIKVVKDAIHDLYLEYSFQAPPRSLVSVEMHGQTCNTDANNNDADTASVSIDTCKIKLLNGEPTESNTGANGNVRIEINTGIENGIHRGASSISALSSGDGLLDFDTFISEMAGPLQTKPELEQYLEEALVPLIQEFDILYWWKLNTLKYPTLSKMARDVLSIPMSMTFPGTMFSCSGRSRILDDHRSSLRHEVVEAIFCAKDWLQHSPTATSEVSASATDKMEG